MSAHILDRLGDLLAGRLDPPEQEKVEAHVSRCPECAAEVAWTRKLRDQAQRQGLRHISAMRIVDLARTPAAATAAEREHLAACADCGGELHWVEGLPAGPAGESESEGEGERASGHSMGGWPRAASWVLGGLAAAASLLLLVYTPPLVTDPSLLAVVEPLPVSLTRGIPQAGSFDESRLLGLEAYEAGNYAGAEEHLSRALERRPDDPEVAVYLGSALMLQGEPVRAAERLRGPALASEDSPFTEEAAWLLANASLLTGDAAEARKLLEALSEGEGHRRADARALLEKMEAVR